MASRLLGGWLLTLPLGMSSAALLRGGLWSSDQEVVRDAAALWAAPQGSGWPVVQAPGSMTWLLKSQVW